MTIPPIGRPWGFAQGGAAPVVSPSVAATTSGPVGFSLQLPLPEIEPIPDAQQFNTEDDVDSGAAVNGVLLPGCSVEVPANYKWVIRGVSIYINDMLTTTDVTWTVSANLIPLAGFNNLKLFPRLAPFVGNNFDALLRGDGPTLLEVRFSNLDGGTYKIGAALSGWFWPAASDQRWKTTGA